MRHGPTMKSRLAYDLLSHPGSLQLKVPHLSFPRAVVIGPHHHRLPRLPRNILKVINLLLLCKKKKRQKKITMNSFGFYKKSVKIQATYSASFEKD